jgi:hypothetical protein
MLILLIILFLVFAGGGGYWFGNRNEGQYGPHFGLGGIVLVLLVVWLLGGFGHIH